MRFWVVKPSKWVLQPYSPSSPQPPAPSPQPPALRENRPPAEGGWEPGTLQLPAGLTIYHKYTSILTKRKHKPQTAHTRSDLARLAGPRGRRTSPACGSCRRPRKERQRKRGAMSRRTTNINEKIKRRREKQKEQENKTQRRSTAGNETKGSTADVADFKERRLRFACTRGRDHRAKTPKCLIFLPTDEQVHKSIKNQ